MRTANSPLLGREGAIAGFMLHRLDLSERTRWLYESLLKRFATWLGQDSTVASVTMDTAEQYLEARRAVVKASSTRADAIVLKSFGNYIGKRILRVKSPLADLRIAQPDDTTRRALTDDELRRLIRVSKQGPYGARDHAIIRVAAGCGLRLGELIALNTQDILWDDGQIIVQGATSKSKKTRRVTMHDEIAAAIDHMGGEDGPLFVSRLGTRFRHQGMAALFRRMSEEASIPDLSPHMLRHTFATNFLRAGTGDLVQLAREAGWRDKQNRMLMRYVHERPLAERRKAPSPFAVLDGDAVVRFPRYHRKAV
jgi:integrase